MYSAKIVAPFLSISPHEDKWQAYVSDGRPLLLEPVLWEDLLPKVESTLLKLALRNYVDVIPLLKPCAGHAKMLQLGQKFYMEQLRWVAFLRGHLLYLPKPIIKRIVGKRMKDVRVAQEDGTLECFRMNAKFAVSCESLAQLLPEHKAEIEQNGKVAGKGFPNDDLWGIAQDHNVIIGGAKDHPLEENPAPPKKPPPKPKNNLPPPPRIPSTWVARRIYPLNMSPAYISKQDTARACKDSATLERLQGVRTRLHNAAEERCYLIDDVPVDRYQFMEYLTWAVSNGELLSDVAKGINGMPSMMEVHKWKTMHPDFARNMEIAEAVQAHVFADKAHAEVMAVSDKDEVPVAKLKSQFFMKRAALQAEKFRDKQVIQTEDLDKKDERDLRRQLAALLMANPELLMAETMDGEVIEDEPLSELSGNSGELEDLEEGV